ncbi:MAG: hypothetical protein KDC69_01725 [Flavobacteriaceae bacterium]|nr:hypothetical protein [Flavobacteriaceae bacterium]
MKNYLSMLFIAISLVINAQSNVYEFGKITQKENDLNYYSKDSTANALYLFENGETVFDLVSGRIVIRTKYYAKIKIFKKEGFNIANVEIPLYKSNNGYEKVYDIKAVTHNGFQRTYLNSDNLIKETVNDHWTLVKFTLPNVREQSIIEYQYTTETPFWFNFTGWEFQAEIPKLKSRFYALIPGNFSYNRRLEGFQPLNTNDASIKRECFSVPGASKGADCEQLTYTMENIPAFIEEDHMTSKKNYLSAIKFELTQVQWFDGTVDKFTKTWKDVDKEFKNDKEIGRQLKKVDFIKKLVPGNLLTINNDLEKAKAIYDFIKSHFTWNEKIRLFKDVDVKKAFDEKVGNSTEINIALIDALNAANIETKIVLISTRSNGLPTKLYPVMSDFDYAIAYATIDGKNYLLDATHKEMPFGLLPFRCLNSYGRVMDFKAGSFWVDILPVNNSKTQLSLNMELNESGDFQGFVNEISEGYNALIEREKINAMSEDKYLRSIEDNNDKLIINNYKNYNLTDLDTPLKETYDITIESNLTDHTIIFNPFLFLRIVSNPFKLEERTYPIDFGYPRTLIYNMSLKIPEDYEVKSLPKDVSYKLPDAGGNYILKVEQAGDKINLMSQFTLSKSYFYPTEYNRLKEFYNRIIKTQNSLITLEKI